MPWTKEKEAAYKKLEEAIDAIEKAYGAEGVRTGYVLFVSSVLFKDERHEDLEDEDDNDVIGALGIYEKRGQSPHLTMGIVQDYQELSMATTVNRIAPRGE